MLSYILSEALVKRLKKLSDLAAEKMVFLSSLNENCKEEMKKYARVSNIGSTTRIENAVLTDTEILWMDERLSADGKTTAFEKEKRFIENKLSKDRERSIEEVAGCRGMLNIVYDQAEELFPLSQTTICGLHQELLKYYPPASHYLGKYKIAPNNVVEKITDGKKILSSRDVLKTADPGPITETAMHDLVGWYNKELREDPWAIAVASEFVFRFLAIHPFQDGNGRMGRALFTLSVLQSGDKTLETVMPFLAVDRHIEKRKQEYYLVLQRCSGGIFSPDPAKYDIGQFLTFMLKILEESIGNDIDFYAGRYRAYNGLADAPRTILSCFKEYPEKRMALKDILRLTNIPRRTVIHAINALEREQFLQKYGKGPSAKYQVTF